MNLAKMTVKSVPIEDIKIVYTLDDGTEIDRAREDFGDLDAFWNDISTRGLQQPILINTKSQLVDGGRRRAAYIHGGQTHIPAVISSDYDDVSDLLIAEAAGNSERKDFTVAERLKINNRLRPVLEEMNKKKMAEGAKKSAAKKKKGKGEPEPESDGEAAEANGKSAEEGVESSHTADVLAKLTGWSTETLRKATEVQEAAIQKPKKFGKLLERMKETGKVGGVYSELKNLQKPQKRDAAAGPIKDANGQEVPTEGGLADRFADQTLIEIEDHCRQVLESVRRFATPLKNVANSNLWLRLERDKGETLPSIMECIATAEKAVRAVQEGILAAIPHIVCPECGGKKCPHCHNSGFYPEWKADEHTGTVGKKAKAAANGKKEAEEREPGQEG